MAVKEIIKRISAPVVRLLGSCGVIPRDIVLSVDGGICSQMHFFMIGRILAQNGQKVYFDTRWFERDGKDTDGRFARTLDICRLFPDLTLPEAPGWFRQLVLSAAYHTNKYESKPEEWMKLRGPKFIDGYFSDHDLMYTQTFGECFRLDRRGDRATYAKCAAIWLEELVFDTCAIHVRRGDLSVSRPPYGNPATVEYFVKAVEAVERHVGRRVKFYIFSDEPDWVAANLLPRLHDRETELMTANGSERGYCDLKLMAACRHIITSRGSMGKYAALLRECWDKNGFKLPGRRDGLVVMPAGGNTPEWSNRFAKSEII